MATHLVDEQGKSISMSNPLPVTDAGMSTGIGALDDPAQTDPNQDASAIALLKGVLTQLNAVLSALGGSLAVDATLVGHSLAEADAVPVNAVGGHMVATLVDNVSLADDSDHTSDAVDVSAYSRVALRVLNTHDEAVTISLLCGDTDTDTRTMVDDQGNPIEVQVSALMTAPALITDADWPPLRFSKFAVVNYKAAATPSTGSLTVEVIGRR